MSEKLEALWVIMRRRIVSRKGRFADPELHVWKPLKLFRSRAAAIRYINHMHTKSRSFQYGYPRRVTWGPSA